MIDLFASLDLILLVLRCDAMRCAAMADELSMEYMICDGFSLGCLRGGEMG